MHALQPMQTVLSKSTIPSSRRNIAPVGHAATHGASAHWLQRVTWNARRAWGKMPTSTDLTYVRVTPTGTSFSLLQAVAHAWHPMHLVWSSTFTQRTGGPPSGVITRRYDRVAQPNSRTVLVPATRNACKRSGSLESGHLSLLATGGHLARYRGQKSLPPEGIWAAGFK
jgi:hypothetical protein